jgi:hypothetical protein
MPRFTSAELFFSCSRLPPAGPQKNHAEAFGRWRRLRNNSWQIYQRRIESTANDSSSSKARRSEGYVSTAQRKPRSHGQ